jgi:hypothetical protein
MGRPDFQLTILPPLLRDAFFSLPGRSLPASSALQLGICPSCKAFSVAPCQTFELRFATCVSLYALSSPHLGGGEEALERGGRLVAAQCGEVGVELVAHGRQHGVQLALRQSNFGF